MQGICILFAFTKKKKNSNFFRKEPKKAKEESPQGAGTFCGRIFKYPEGAKSIENCEIFFIGSNGPFLTTLTMNNPTCNV